VCARCVPGALARLQTSSEVSKAFAHSTTLTSCELLCAQLTPCGQLMHVASPRPGTSL
jgi:hypothetical protein